MPSTSCAPPAGVRSRFARSTSAATSCRSACASPSGIFGPEAPYERVGDVDNVAFPCGYTVGTDGDTINLYYGGADSCVALATGSIRRLLGWLDEQGPAS